MFRKSHALLLTVAAIAGAGCTAGPVDGPDPDMTRDEARALANESRLKGDHGFDLCDWLGWYGDGICDDFCLQPDPDCEPEAECRVDSDCPQPLCLPGGPCPSNVCVEGECILDDTTDRCDAGQRECPTCNGNFVCAPWQVSCPLVRCPPPAESCGGIAGFTCSDPDQFCLYEDDAMCGAADQMGTCTDRPDVCTREFRPVCGCDGNTYGNRCDAHASGVSVVHDGACEPPVVGCRTGGCSGQLCIPEDSEPIFTTCEWRAEYACYQSVGTCERQADGSCGWTDTPELAACLSDVL